MVLPLIAWGTVALVTAIAGSCIVYNWDDLKAFWNNKKVVILGQRETGKTSLLYFLLEGTMVENPSVTTGIDTVSTKYPNKKLADLKLHVTQKDYSGSEGCYDSWQKGAAEADLFIYLFRIDEWMKDTEKTEANIQRDLDILKQVTMKKNMPLFLIGTHLDRLEGIEFNNISEKNKFIQEIVNEMFFKGIKKQFGKGQGVHLHLGSLKDTTGLTEIADFILSHAKES